MKLPKITADYSTKQLKTAFAIAVSVSFAVILVMLFNYIVLKDNYSYNPFQRIDNQITDRFFYEKYRNLEEPPVLNELLSEIVIISIDDSSLGSETFPQWPIPRSRYGELLRRLHVGGAKTVGFDIIMDTSSVEEEDNKFQKALAQYDNVFMPVFFTVSLEKVHDELIDSGAIDIETWEREQKQQNSDAEVYKKTHNETEMVVYPYKPFYESLMQKNNESEQRIGFVSVEIADSVRLLPLSRTISGETYKAFSVMMAAHYLDIPQNHLINKPEENQFMLGDIVIPTYKNHMLINYLFGPPEMTFTRKAKTDYNIWRFFQNPSLSNLIENIRYKKVSAGFNIWQWMEDIPIKDLFEWEDEEIEGIFDGKIILVGATAIGAMDIKPTPLGQIPGVYAHANMILSMLSQQFIVPASFSYNLLTVLFAGLLMGLIIPRLTPAPGAALTFLGCFSYFGFSYWRFVNQGVINFVAAPVFCSVLGMMLINVYHHIAERKTRESISRMFREFAPLPSPMIEKYVQESGGSAATGGSLAHVSVLFADIRGYTDLSESLTSQEVMELLNEYHTEMGKVFEETGGVIFTYIGDAQLVVYGLAEKSKINHAASSIKAGLLMQERLDMLKAKWESENKKTFEVGVGICTGELSIGVVGSSQLKQYTVIGDTVNVASRIQGMSRELESPTLIHERTYLMARHCIESEALRPIKLKGKKYPVNVYRAKRVLEITPYPGNEITDLDREVEELHQKREEALRRLKASMEKPISPEYAIGGKSFNINSAEAGSDASLLTPLEEECKGKVCYIKEGETGQEVSGEKDESIEIKSEKEKASKTISNESTMDAVAATPEDASLLTPLEEECKGKVCYIKEIGGEQEIVDEHRNLQVLPKKEKSTIVISNKTMIDSAAATPADASLLTPLEEECKGKVCYLKETDKTFRNKEDEKS